LVLFCQFGERPYLESFIERGVASIIPLKLNDIPALFVSPPRLAQQHAAAAAWRKGDLLETMSSINKHREMRLFSVAIATAPIDDEPEAKKNPQRPAAPTGHALEVWTSAGAARLGLRRLDAALCFCPFCRTDPAVSQRFLPPDLIEPPFPMQHPASVSESAGATQLKEASSGRTVRLRAHLVGEVKVLSK